MSEGIAYFKFSKFTGWEGGLPPLAFHESWAGVNHPSRPVNLSQFESAVGNWQLAMK